MKKMKKFLAMFLAMAMVLGMSLTAFAANDAKITVLGFASEELADTVPEADKVNFDYARIIEPDTNAVTGWKFSTAEIEEIYRTAFYGSKPIEGEDIRGKAQDVLAELIDIEKNKTAETSEKIAKALKEIQSKGISGIGLNVQNIKHVTGSNELPVDGVGVYYIAGTQKGYNYNPMTAYIKFGEYNTTTGTPGEPESTTVNAKRVKNVISKTSDVENGVTEIGKTVNYTVTSTVPFLPLTDTNRHYEVIDVISGAAYITEEIEIAGVKTEVVKLTVKYGDTEDSKNFCGVLSADKKSFTADLSSLLTKTVTDGEGNEEIVNTNDNANMPLVITYSARVTGTKVGNDAFMGDGTNDGRDKFGSSEGKNDLYTGWIEITKYASDDTNDDLTDNVKLENAGFVVYKTVTTDEGTSNLYATFKKQVKMDDNDEPVKDEDGNVVREFVVEDGALLFDGWVAEENADVIYTGSNGKVKVNGLAEGTYSILEKVAPEGYSVNDKVVTAELKADRTVTEANPEGKVVAAFGDDRPYVIDTKLNALPSTGGIGTTIFTIGGCVIMVAAAGLFFATRKKSSEK